MTKLLSSVGVALVCLLAGCSLYFGPSNSSGGSGNGATGGGSGNGGGNPPGFECNGDAQCAPGCFCSNGICAEGGFCVNDKDCGNGFHCDVSRSSCIPNPVCTSDLACSPGSACDPATGACVETCACANDAEAIEKGFGWCDESRKTCMKGIDPKGACLGDITCTAQAPACPAGQVALRKDGCFTGGCRAIAECEAAPVCPSLQHQVDCQARSADCSTIFLGHNCHGTTCGVSDDDCVCESYTFQSCAAKGTMTIVPGA